MTRLFRNFQFRISKKVLLVPMLVSWSALCGTVEETRLRLQFALNESAASDALQVGLPRIAISLYKDALEHAAKAQVPQSQARKLRLGLTSSFLAVGEIELAKEELKILEHSGAQSDEALLHLALISFLERDAEGLRKLMAELKPEDVSEGNRSWVVFLQGMAASSAAASEALYSQSLKMAITLERRADFRLLRYRNEILETGGSEVLAANLKRQMEEFRGRSAGQEFAVQYVMVLNSLGKKVDALEELRRQLELVGNEKGIWRDRLLLLYGVLSSPEDDTGRAVLESLVETGTNHEWMGMGLRLLTSRFEINEKITSFLDNILKLPDHKLYETILVMRLKLALELKQNAVAERCALRIMEEFPGSPQKPDAIRALAAAAWRGSPPKYRLTADFLRRLSKLEEKPDERNRLSLQVADCHFLAGDYDSAAALYLEVHSSAKSHLISDRALSRAINSFLATDDIDKSIDLLDEFSNVKGSKELLWKAEWNLLVHLREHNRLKIASERTLLLLNNKEKLVPRDLTVRLLWMDASLALQMNKPEEALKKSERVIDFLTESEGFSVDLDNQVRAQVLLTKGRAFLGSSQEAQAAEVFTNLHLAYPHSDESAFSYLVEAYHHASRNRLDEAQRNLLRLADGFKKSRYAPRALYEAALHLERRGMDENLKEGVDLLERLIQEYPDDELVFYARLRQANLLRRRNEFGSALELCKQLLGNNLFREHPQKKSAYMLRADCLLALARNDRQKLFEVAEAYAELKSLQGHSPEMHAEAAYKEGLVFRRMEDVTRAKVIYFRDIIKFFLSDINRFSDVKASGKYWISRSLLDLGEILDREGDSNGARSVYRMLLAHGLPGRNLARARFSPNENSSPVP
jgi:outer membrane protein assembly factor BamD (BamD/ComL family)